MIGESTDFFKITLFKNNTHHEVKIFDEVV